MAAVQFDMTDSTRDYGLALRTLATNSYPTAIQITGFDLSGSK